MRTEARVLGQRVRALRQQLGLSQEDLADRARVDAKTVRNIENGRRVPRPSTLRQLAGALELTGDDRDEFCASGTREALDDGAGRPAAVPAQLPLDVHGFTGRVANLNALDAIAAAASQQATAVVIAAVWGTAGVGKTALAVHWAHQVAERFPGGQLYANLRGFDPAGTPMDPGAVIRGFLDALGVPAQRIPASLDGQAALYRSLLAGTKMLVVLDNASDEAQVRPLLPGSPTSMVIVTSRHRLVGLIAAENAYSFTLGLLTTDEAHDLLASRLDSERLAAEPHAVAELIGLCAHLPLALSVAAARTAAHPQLSVATLAEHLRSARDRLDELDTGDAATNVRAVLSWSYQRLTSPAQRMFRLLGVHAGPDIAPPAAANLAGITPARARPLLAELARAHLVEEHTPGRLALHDLLRLYASELAHELEPQAEQRAAIHRILDHYLHTAHAATRLLDPHRDPISLTRAQPGVSPEDIADHKHALMWFTAEHAVLMTALKQAAEANFNTHACQLAWTLEDFLDRRGYWHDWAATQSAALDSVVRLSDLSGQARAHRGLAGAYTQLGRHDDAQHHLRHALDLYDELGDHVGQAHTHLNFGRVSVRQGLYRYALNHARQALELYRAADHRTGQANALNSVGWYHAQLGNHQEALTYCHQALTLQQDIGDHVDEAGTWDSLGYVHHHLGDRQEAIACYQQALRLFQKIGDRYFEADTLTRLAETHYAAGDADSARSLWQRALGIFHQLGHRQADHIRAKLERLGS
jgi:tetratricopeptide (TPR) repeat protein/transcriptional regulator with XRE-family HTH domain